MKNTNRIRKHRSAAPSARRVKTPSKERTIAVVCFKAGVVFEAEDDAIAAQFEFPESIFNQLQPAAAQAGVSLSAYIMQACQEKLSRASAALPTAAIKANAAKDHQYGDVDLMLVSEKEGLAIAGVNLSTEEFAKLQRRAVADGITLEQSLCLGFNRMVNPLPSAQHQIDFSTLADTIESAGSLLMVLAEKAEDKGLRMLASHTVLRLMTHCEAAGTAFNIPAPELSLAQLNGGAL